MLQEFKSFLIKGNAVDMAVGFIFGAAFAGVVKSFIVNVIMPPIGLLMGGVDFSNLKIVLGGDAAIKYGQATMDLINFVILGAVVFLLVKAINKMQKEKEEVKEEPKTPEDVELLREIRDSLKNN